ncbi:MAG TPA: CDF family Co(II)/Ni(II) efflux transporter DmeF [Devosia sp.]|nr:CDF family Co(II)/Ni(II) efflux transporter DmeF [Devosia sp.]
MAAEPHSHVFLGSEHQSAERRTWAVIWLCAAMMAAEIGGGWLFGSIALIADGLHMSTHAGALLLAALAYRYARRHARDERFSFGTGKVGDLAGFTSAVVLVMIALLIGYESIARLFAPVPIDFGQAIPIAIVGLLVNIASAWLLSGGAHHHHGHGREHGHGEDETKLIETERGLVRLEIFEDGVPPRFRLRAVEIAALDGAPIFVETARPDGTRQRFSMADRGDFLESVDEIPEPHAFTAELQIGGRAYAAVFEEHGHGHAGHHHDNNMRAAIVHVMADAAVSVLVIAGLVLARAFGWTWMDPAAGIVGACVIASWSYGLIRDTGGILLDMTADRSLASDIRRLVERQGDTVSDLHVWRLGPGHLGAIVAVRTTEARDCDFYHRRLSALPGLSHVTVEVQAA